MELVNSVWNARFSHRNFCVEGFKEMTQNPLLNDKALQNLVAIQAQFPQARNAAPCLAVYLEWEEMTQSLTEECVLWAACW